MFSGFKRKSKAAESNGKAVTGEDVKKKDRKKSKKALVQVEKDEEDVPKVYSMRKIYTDPLIRNIFQRKVYRAMSTLQNDLNAFLSGGTPVGPKQLKKLQANYQKVNELLEFLDPVLIGAECRAALDNYEKMVMQQGGGEVVHGRGKIRTTGIFLPPVTGVAGNDTGSAGGGGGGGGSGA